MSGKTPGFSGRGGESLADIFSSKVWQLDLNLERHLTSKLFLETYLTFGNIFNIKTICDFFIPLKDEAFVKTIFNFFIPLKDGAFVPNKHRAFLMDTQVKYTIVSPSSRSP